MDIKKFFLSGYKNATKDFYIEKISNPTNALIPHTHDYFQVYFCQRGKLTHHMKEKSATLYRGNVFILPPGTLHHIEKNVDDTVFFTLSFKYDFLSSRELTNKFACDFLNSLKTNVNINPSLTLAPDEIIFFEYILGKMIDEFSENKVGSEDILKDMTATLITKLARISLEEENSLYYEVYDKKQFISYCISYLDVHFDEEISLTDIAKRSAMSKSTFCTLFREATGMSFKEYLNKKRIQKAISLMKKGEKITEAAKVSGYLEFSTFYRNFIKYTGYSPEEYVQIRFR